jgi:fluoride exporter
MIVLSVAVGGALGAVCRYSVNQLAMRYDISPLLATGLVNIIGSFFIGMMAQALTDNPSFVKAWPFIATGFLGGLTTFSTFSLETIRLLQNGEIIKAAFYISLSVTLALVGLWAGMQIVR